MKGTPAPFNGDFHFLLFSWHVGKLLQTGGYDHMDARQWLGALSLTWCVVSGCSDSVVAPGDSELSRDPPAFQTDALAYALHAGSSGYAFKLDVVFTNRTPRTAYFVGCVGPHHFTLEKLVGAQWHRVWSPIVPLCGGTPIPVPAGATHRVTPAVFAGYPGGNTLPRFDTSDIPGTYRAVWQEVVSSNQDGSPGAVLPLHLRVSNRFSLTVQP